MSGIPVKETWEKTQSIETHGSETLLSFSLLNKYVEKKVTWI